MAVVVGIISSDLTLHAIFFQECREGEEVILECVTTGFPVPEFYWYRNAIPIQPNSDFQILNSKENLSR